MATKKVLKRPVTVADKDHEPETFEVGDEVPSWASEYVDEELYDEYDAPTAAGLDLTTDHTWAEMRRAADRAGVEVKDSWSSDQIAAAIRHKLFDEEQEEVHGDEYESDYEDMTKAFDEVNKAGNVNAPDGKTAKSADTTPSGSPQTKSRSGGSNS